MPNSRRAGSKRKNGSPAARSKPKSRTKKSRPGKPEGKPKPQGRKTGSKNLKPSAPRDQRRNSSRRESVPVKGLGGNQVEGRQAVRELLLAGKRKVHEVVILDDSKAGEPDQRGFKTDTIVNDISDLASEMGVTVSRFGRKRFLSEAVTQSHQGVLAKASSLVDVPLQSLMEDPNAFLVVIDGVTDPQNLGSILRTAECAGVTGVVLAKHRSVKITPTVTKTAAGAVEHVPLALVGGIPAALAEMQENQIFSVGLDEAGGDTIYSLNSLQTAKIALVLGAEGKGLSRLVKQRVDLMASIPLAGYLNSLNVGTASAVACFEVVRSRSRM